jgi:hypothetical protein
MARTRSSCLCILVELAGLLGFVELLRIRLHGAFLDIGFRDEHVLLAIDADRARVGRFDGSAGCKRDAAEHGHPSGDFHDR